MLEEGILSAQNFVHRHPKRGIIVEGYRLLTAAGTFQRDFLILVVRGTIPTQWALDVPSTPWRDSTVLDVGLCCKGARNLDR